MQIQSALIEKYKTLLSIEKGKGPIETKQTRPSQLGASARKIDPYKLE